MVKTRTTRISPSTAILMLIALLFCALSPAQSVDHAKPPATYNRKAVVDAISAGDLEAVIKQLGSGIPIQSIDHLGMTLLHWAATEDQVQIARYLLNWGIDVDATNKEGNSAVHLAVIHGKTKVALFLADAGAQLDAPSAAATGRAQRLRQLIKANPGLLKKMWYFHANPKERTLIQIAASFGSSKSIATLVELGANPKSMDGGSFTPLHSAAAWGHVEAVAELLKHDDRINKANRYGWTPLKSAASNGHLRVVEYLLAHGADYDFFTATSRSDLKRMKAISDADSSVMESEIGLQTPVIWAARLNQSEALHWLMDQGAQINKGDDLFGTPLSIAVWYGHTRIVKMLLKGGANPEVGAGKAAYGTALHRACYRGNIELAMLLLDHDANLESVDDTDETPILFAVKQGHLELVERLLQRGANPNGKGQGKPSPLATAAWEGQFKIVKLLLTHGVDINQGVRGGGTPLHRAASRGDLEMVKLFLEQGIDKAIAKDDGETPLHLAGQCWDAKRLGNYRQIVDLLLRHGYSLEARHRGNYTVLHQLLYNGRHPIEMLKHVLNRGADVRARTGMGLTALHLACYRKNPKLAEILLDHGARVNVVTKDGRMPCHLVLADPSAEAQSIVKLLQQRGMKLDIIAHAQLGQSGKVLAELDKHPELLDKVFGSGIGGGKQTLLHIASSRGNLPLVKQLVERGAKVDLKPNGFSWTPLHCAAGAGHAEVVQYLIGHGGKSDLPDAYLQGPLRAASRAGHADVVALLIAHGVNVNVNASWVYAPLNSAASQGHLRIVKLLLDAGTDIHTAGDTALDAAIRGGHADIVELLIQRGANVKNTRNSDSPPLFHAATHGSEKMVSLLIEAGVDVNLTNERNDTALDWALGNGNHETVEILRRAGALQGHEILPHQLATQVATLEKLIPQLDDDSFAVRQRADKAIRAYGPEYVRAVRKALASATSPEVKSRLKRILVWMETESKEVQDRR